MTFEPLPREFFAKDGRLKRLMRFKEKWLELLHYSIDYVLCLRFNAQLARLSAEDFVRQILVDTLHAQAIVVGDDCHFGANRKGDYNLLQQLGRYYGFSSYVLPAVLQAGERISSTRIRQALQQGHLAEAASLLGRPYRISGRVEHGEKRGRALGFPTANISLRNCGCLLSGIFVVQVYVADTCYRGVASIGSSPTFHSVHPSIKLEAYLFDFDDDLYGHDMAIDFLYYLRPEVQYQSSAQLIEAIEQDVKDATLYFSKKHLD